MITNVNGVANYKRYRTREICKAVRELSPERKLVFLNTIQDTRILKTFIGESYNQQTYAYVESLLNGKSPKGQRGEEC